VDLIPKILAVSPYAEVVARRIYWSSPWLIELARRRGFAKPRPNTEATQLTWGKIEDFLRHNGVRTGSLIIVHSSAAALKPTGLSPSRIIDKLIELVGPSGTLAMPAFPKYEEEPQGIDRVRADVSNLELVYDVQKSVPWTGVLPLRLMRYPGAVRSRHPLNTMVAVGPLAGPMMENNMMGERPLPCGAHSTWKYCADHKAIIVALGVDMAHSITMIHVAEDLHEAEWPVRNWYRDRKFQIVDHGASCHVVVRERHPRWAAHYAERTLSQDLLRHGLMASARIDGIPVEVVAADKLLQFLARRRATAYPYFMIPSSLRKDR
jgi:aminoglycoside 3-N-acetyltransferase